jgi:hypothetical protein
VRLEPEAVDFADADDAYELGARYGLALDEWQLIVLRSWLARRRDGKWAANRAGLAVPRQNGKNAAVEVRELFGIVMLGEKWLHSAHEVKTARKAFLRLASFFENERQYPELADLVADIRKTNGQEAVVLTNGGSVEFIARSKSSGRGFTVDGILLDEAQELTDEALAALLPTKSASPLGNPQTIYTGTPPGPKVSGEVFTRMRVQGVKGADRRLSWLEWGAPRDADLDDREAWARANPALGIRLSVDEILDERAQMSAEDFGRERLGWWDDVDASGRAIDMSAWGALEDATSKRVGGFVLAIDIDPDRTEASIVMYGVRADGVGHSELIERSQGTAWVIPRLIELRDKHKPLAIVIGGNSPAAALGPDLVRAGVEPLFATQTDYARACGAYRDAVTDGSLRHIGQVELTASMGAVKARNSGDAFVWDRRGGKSITAAVAATLARWGWISTLPEREYNPLNNIF